MRTLESALKEQMKNPIFKAEYEALEAEFVIIQTMIDAKKSSGVVQNGDTVEHKVLPKIIQE